MADPGRSAEAPYEALEPGGETPSIWSLSRLARRGLARLPGARARFAQSLHRALQAATSQQRGFHLNVADARAALGEALVIEVDPQRLSMRLREHIVETERPLSIADRFLGAGDWGPLLAPARMSPTVWEVNQIVANGFDFRGTVCFERYLARARAGDPVKRNHVVLDTRERIEAYLGHSVEMLRSVQANGVLARRQWRARRGRLAGRGRLIEASEQEVGVAIGPEGEIYRFCAGKHRTAAAVALKIARIPVEVRLVHARWLASRVELLGIPPIEALAKGVGSLHEA